MNNRFSTRLIAAVSIIALTQIASAADLPVKAPMYRPAAPVDPWTGFYIGGSIGARWSDVDWQTIFIGGGVDNIDNPAHLDSTSVRVGGYAGYNWRIAPSWLVGLEADIAWAHSSKTHTPFPGGLTGGGSVPGFDFVSVKLDWDGSARGRLGYLVTPNWLVYATGGAAWQKIEAVSSCVPGGFCAGAVFSGTTSTTKTGWTIGGGVETALWTNWLARLEYRYADFGHVTNVLPPAPGVGMTSEVSVKTNIALLGLAYKF